jgi:hypothetical protein
MTPRRLILSCAGSAAFPTVWTIISMALAGCGLRGAADTVPADRSVVARREQAGTPGLEHRAAVPGSSSEAAERRLTPAGHADSVIAKSVSSIHARAVAGTASDRGVGADHGAGDDREAGDDRVTGKIAAPPAGTRLTGSSSFTIAAKAMSRHIVLKSDRVADATGFLCMGGAAGGGEHRMAVMRLASFGRSDSPIVFTWVLSVAEREGTLLARRANSGMEVELTGRFNLLLTLKGATKPIHLVSRELPLLRGTAGGWPPVGATLILANGPIGLFRENLVNDSAATPLIIVEGVELRLGADAGGYFAGAPSIVRARGDREGVSLEWRSSPGGAAIDGYNIYGSDDPADPGGWKLLASVPAEQTTYHDPGSGASAYMIAHRAAFPMGFQYEGVYSAPYMVKR